MIRAITLCALLAFAGFVPANAGEPAPFEIDAMPLGPSPQQRLDEIRRRVQAAVHYPGRARELGMEGTTRIQFQVGIDGLAQTVSVVETSGHSLLDAAAERGALDAGQLPALYGWIRIPVQFDLEKAQRSAAKLAE